MARKPDTTCFSPPLRPPILCTEAGSIIIIIIGTLFVWCSMSTLESSCGGCLSLDKSVANELAPLVGCTLYRHHVTQATGRNQAYSTSNSFRIITNKLVLLGERWVCIFFVFTRGRKAEGTCMFYESHQQRWMSSAWVKSALAVLSLTRADTS